MGRAERKRASSPLKLRCCGATGETSGRKWALLQSVLHGRRDGWKWSGHSGRCHATRAAVPIAFLCQHELMPQAHEREARCHRFKLLKLGRYTGRPHRQVLTRNLTNSKKKRKEKKKRAPERGFASEDKLHSTVWKCIAKLAFFGTSLHQHLAAESASTNVGEICPL